jgi:hypothetical protein
MRLLALAAALALTVPLSAQVTAPRPVTPTAPVIRKDTTKRADSAQADSTGPKVLIKWEEPDSVTTALLARQGYSVTRYQGVHVRFDAKSRTLYLEGGPAGVGRAETLLVGDTITYNDSTKIVFARGDTLILRDPSRGSADVIALGQMRYNVESRRGSVTNISTSVESGEKWYVFGAAAGFVNDTTGGKTTSFYARNGSITSCDDSIPDYHFQSKEIKLISKNLLVARPAVLYIGDVPVFWLPFIFQDMRSGRRSGMLTPRFGVNEIFRNSPSYRRHVDNFGYYFAFSDYMDAQVSMDWRSGAASSDSDPGWFRLNGEWRYRWLDRFLTGRFGVSQLWQRDGTRNTALSWGHQQDFSQSSKLTTDINYVTSTALQRRNSFDPNSVLATIRSNISYQQKFGPASMSIGGSRVQYPGRDEVTQDFPNFTISTPTLSLGNRFDWTPSLDVRNNEQLHVNRNGEFAFDPVDSTRLQSDARSTTLNLSTPFKIFGFSIPLSVRVADQENNQPQRFRLVDSSGEIADRVFARSFSTEVDWQSGFSLPQFFSSTLKLSPSISFSNVDGRGFWVRTQFSNGQFVHQKKRFSYGLSATPTVFGLLPGIGPLSRIRHSITTTMSYSYAPAAKVPLEYLRAVNEDPTHYLGSLASNRVTLGVETVFEGKLKSKDTTNLAEPRKIKLIGMNFTPLSYDFERRRQGHNGFTTDNFDVSLNSDLLPGFQGSVQYSLLQGNPLSDSSKFKPFRTGINATFSINGNSGIFGALTRIFGRAVPTANPQVERLGAGPSDALEQRVAATPVAGVSPRSRQFSMPQVQTWTASLTFSSTRQRPPVGTGQIVLIDPREQCRNFIAQPLVYDACILQAQTNPVGAVPVGGISAGGPVYVQPSRETVTSSMAFHITPKWSATWGTTYDFRERQFASHAVTLQRELHDWRSIFAFTRAPNGNFAFNFFIALNAQPDLKFNFDRQTYRDNSQ